MGSKFSKSKPEEESKSSDSNGNSLSNSQEESSYASSSSSTSPNYMNTMDPDSARVAASIMPLKEISKLARTSKANRHMFQPLLEEAKAVLPVLTAVVQGDVEQLKKLVAANDSLFFKKGQVTDSNGTTFYNASPYQLMIFLCDADMKNQLKDFLEPYEAIRRIQYAEIDSGGADLIKMDKDPTTIPFEEVLRFKTSYNDPFNPQNPPTEVAFPLLENEDGIIVFNNHFYYANKKEQTVVPVNPEVHSEEEREALETLKASLSDMVDNSSRRSSNNEHALITATMQRTLKRKGILYERNAHGADLVKMDKDPRERKFEELSPLLENPDGILIYKNNFYYANKETKTVGLINPTHSSNPKQAKLDKEALDKLKESIMSMEANSRRSDNAEHALIERTMGHALQRHTVRFRDSRADFNRLPNAYRKCDKLYQEEKWNEGHKQWREGVGGAQRDVMWLLQRYCEENRPFYPLQDFKASPFRRSVTIFSYFSNRDETILAGGRLHGGFGSGFGLYKGAEGRGRDVRRRPGAGCAWVDLIAVSRLVEDAKTNVVEFNPEQDLENQDENLGPRLV